MTIICLVGSTRFKQAWERTALREALKGNVVLTASAYPHADNLQLTQMQKDFLAEMHLRKIDLAEEVLVINVNGYIGESTNVQILYAKKHGKPVKYLVPNKDEDEKDGQSSNPE